MNNRIPGIVLLVTLIFIGGQFGIPLQEAAADGTDFRTQFTTRYTF